MKIIKDAFNLLLIFITVFLFLWGAMEEGFSRQECADLKKAGYTVKRSMFDCHVLIHDSWMDSEEFMQAEFEKTKTSAFPKKVDTFKI